MHHVETLSKFYYYRNFMLCFTNVKSVSVVVCSSVKQFSKPLCMFSVRDTFFCFVLFFPHAINILMHSNYNFGLKFVLLCCLKLHVASVVIKSEFTLYWNIYNFKIFMELYVHDLHCCQDKSPEILQLIPEQFNARFGTCFSRMIPNHNMKFWKLSLDW